MTQRANRLMSIRIHSIDLRVHNMHVRMPFRYGIVTLMSVPHLFMEAQVEVDGKRQRGISSDHLPPKWFTKNPNSPIRDDIAEMIEVIRSASGLASRVGEQGSVFELWLALYQGQKDWAKGRSYPPLLWNFGVSLVERAIIDAFCRSHGITFGAALRENRLGVDLGRMYRELAPGALAQWARATNSPAGTATNGEPRPPYGPFSAPLRSIIARHTVGLVDPLTRDEIAAADQVNDGLPQALVDVIRTYGIKHFKIKLAGDPQKDAQRLRRLAEIIESHAPPDYGFTLDGNENFQDVQPFRQLWQSLAADKSLTEFLSRLIFVEQPLHRDVALSDGVKRAFLEWDDRPPLIIDESDGELASLPRALECGYIGTSHKNCKGTFKSIANICLIKHLQQESPSDRR